MDRRALWPLLIGAVAVLALQALRGDQWLADRLYAWEGHDWALRHAFLAEAVIHELGRRISSVAWYGVALAWLLSLGMARMQHWRRPLLFLLIATSMSTGVVSALKHATGMDCPWDLARYGGARPFVSLFSARSSLLPHAACFPAGHASAGYAWVALYFFFAATRPRLRWLGLAIGLGAGLLFGITQQLRGAHFLSHDVAAFAICWSLSLVTCHLLLAPRPLAWMRERPAWLRLRPARMEIVE